MATEKLLCSTCAAADSSVDNTKRVLPDADAAGAPALISGGGWHLERLEPETELYRADDVEFYTVAVTKQSVDQLGMVKTWQEPEERTRAVKVDRRRVAAVKFSAQCQGTVCAGANKARWKKVTY